MDTVKGYICSICGKYHEDLPLSYGSDKPEQWYDIAPEEREKRSEFNDDLFVIDDKYFFIRGCIEIPIIDGEGTFTWGVWVTLSKDNFIRANEIWNDIDRENEPPYFGWLCTSIPCYPDTMFLKTQVLTRAVGERPLIEVELTNHPLALEQKTGITMKRVQEIAEYMLHE